MDLRDDLRAAGWFRFYGANKKDPPFPRTRDLPTTHVALGLLQLEA